jgi:hypothetical protein
MEAEGSSLNLNEIRIANTRAYIEQFGDFPYGLDDSRSRPPEGTAEGHSPPVFVERLPDDEPGMAWRVVPEIPEPPTEMPSTVEEFLALAEYHERRLDANRRYRLEQVLHHAAEWVAERDGIDYEQARLYVEERLDV